MRKRLGIIGRRLRPIPARGRADILAALDYINSGLSPLKAVSDGVRD